MSGMFEVLASAPDLEREAAQQAQDRLAAAVHDVREEFGDFLFASRDIREFRNRVALVKSDMMAVIDRTLPPVSGVMGRIATRRGSILEKEFKSRQAMRKGAPFAGYDDFDDCTSKNSDKGDPSAYCGEIKHRTEDKKESARRQADLPGLGTGGGLDDKLLSSDDIAKIPGMGQYPSMTQSGGPQVGQEPQTPGAKFQPVRPLGGRTPQQAARAYLAYCRKTGSRPTKVGLRAFIATGDGPDLDTDVTFEDHRGQELEPKGNFPAYLDSVDQGARSKIEDNFVDNPKGQEHTEAVTARRRRAADERARFVQEDEVAPSDDLHGPPDFAFHTERPAKPFGPGLPPERPEHIPPRGAAKVTRQFAAFCKRNKLPLRLSTLERHGTKLSERDYLTVAADLQRLGWTDVVAKKRTAAPDFLSKAEDALTGLLQQKGEEFQEQIAPFQQALQTIQQAKQLGQTPLNMAVQPPAGTINVLPTPPGGDPTGLGLPPAAGGAPGDPTAPPPAAAAGGGLPPDPTADPGQTLARRGGRPKGEPRSGGVVEDFQHYMEKSPGLGRGGDPDIEEFESTHPVGERAHNKLKQQLVTPVTASVKRQAWMGWGPSVIDPPARKVAGWEWDRQLEAYVANRPGKFACNCGTQMDMPGHHTCTKCGKIWNGYDIEGGGSHHEASTPVYLVREIPVRPEVIVANLQAAAAVGDDDEEFPSDHHPKVPGTPAAPTDWSNRDHKNRYAPQQLNKRRR